MEIKLELEMPDSRSVIPQTVW